MEDGSSYAETTMEYYGRTYMTQGFNAQRRYPNEEFCRFMGRNFFEVPLEKRRDIKILETGCGSGANLWMLAREGFSAYGQDISSESIRLAEAMLKLYGCQASLDIGDMTALPYADECFEAIVDIFSSNCLPRITGKTYLASVFRTLKKNGLFFSYFPAKTSDAFKRHEPATLIDEDTLSGIYRTDSPFAGNHYPFRFMHAEEYEQLLREAGFTVQYCETVSRTYNNGKETFSFITIEARKP